MGDNAHDEERERKRKKALRRMGKIVAKAWNIPGSEPFQDSPASTAVLSLSAVGQKIDSEKYGHGRHGWEDFARDMGGVYNRHLKRKGPTAKVAKAHLQEVCDMLLEKDKSLVKLASEHFPVEKSELAPKLNKRKTGSENSAPSNQKKKPKTEKKTNADMTIAEKEEHSMQSLFDFVEQKGGSRDSVKNYTCRVTRKPSDGRYDTKYYNEDGKPFRSMLEVGRFLNLVKDSQPTKKKLGFGKRKTTSREIEAEKKKIRKELDKLRKQHTRAVQALDDFVSENRDARYPVEDMILQEEEEENSKSKPAKKVSRSTCAGARKPDILGFPTVPQHCLPDLLMAWDFMCTFSRTLSVNPIELDDFVQALTYEPPKQLAETDAFSTAPVYLAEAHIGLLRLLILDSSSDEWWWSILETEETENMKIDPNDTVAKDDNALPLIKVDFAALMAEPEDPLMTTSWLRNLEDIKRLNPTNAVAIKTAVKTALDLVENKFVRAYLRKALRLGKTSGPALMHRAVLWLHDRVHEAHSDSKNQTKIVEEVSNQMSNLGSATLAVNNEELASDVESDDDSDDSDDEDAKPSVEEAVSEQDPGTLPASVLPPKPPPTLVDLLLPPAKPPLEILNTHSWSYIAGAAACRILHRFKRLRNEIDDCVRNSKELPRLTVAERRSRELLSTSRVFTESCMTEGNEDDPCEKAVDHLCSGGKYLNLSTQERLAILRVLIEAAYDTKTVYETVDLNYKTRTSAAKTLDAEQRKAKREAKEKLAADEAAARDDLAYEAKRKFLEEKREEIRRENEEGSHELTNEEIDTLTEEDIIELDDDTKADYDALPAPHSFKKAEVMERVAKIHEAAAFEAIVLHVLTMEELVEREKQELAALQEQFEGLGGENALLDPSLDRDTSRAIERIRRDIEKLQAEAGTLPKQRQEAVEAIREANADGTIKALRNAIRIAKAAKLFGADNGGGMWSLDVVRDSHVELFNAKQSKKTADAQKSLVSKLARLFTRTNPLGSDRFGNRFWHFDNSERGHIWVEADYVIKESGAESSDQPGFVDLTRSIESVSIGAEDVEEDLAPVDKDETLEDFRRFSRMEYHVSGATSSLVKRHWGSHVTDSSLTAVMKSLDSRGVRENHLKTTLKEALEEKTATRDGPPEQTAEPDDQANDQTKTNVEVHENTEEDAEDGVHITGDESALEDAKEVARADSSDNYKMEAIEGLSTAIGETVRVRIVLEATRDGEVARYENGSISGWKMRKEVQQVPSSEPDVEPEVGSFMAPVWKATTERGRDIWLSGMELMDSISRFSRWQSKDNTYFETDAAFLAYRNSLGRFCGRAADAAQGATPIRFAQIMVKKEADLYQKLRNIIYDNSWGGKSAPRNAWISSMKDFAFDFETVREGLLTLESTFVALTETFSGENGDHTTRSGRDLLDDPSTRNDIELESIEKVAGIWNSRASRNVFLEIVKTCTSTGFLSLALDLLCRNTNVYLDANTLLMVKAQEFDQPRRATRRMNAWQQKGWG